ncbi:zinc-binding alcohol dehydrogenase family protein [Microbacterium rhizomatis]|uniref:alcohol dehydrogenase n=2 Tax=Microbacterium rhizomatis TaxID=1631477 RepID=A0A5J5J6R4_9MICO|nr:zinc-binding alcohol dehydrogenase family protein [Microbacterium rhizomatis]
MRAWATASVPGVMELIERPVPTPLDDEVLVRVEACGACRTDLHVVDRELPVHLDRVTPGHQVVGIVAETGRAVRELRIGDRVGIAWLRHTCGTCRWCRAGQENLCPSSEYTGWDAHGGFAEYATVAEAFAYVLPADADPVAVAPLLCAGIIGYRALTRAHLPVAGRLGIYGYGSSAHLTAQVAMAQGADVFVMTRGERNRELARRAGASFVGEAADRPPVVLDSAIVFAPAGELVPLALQATVRGGTVVLAGIHMSDIPAMSYAHNLFHERDLRTVTANTRADGAEFLRVAAALGIAASTTTYSFEHAADALEDLRAGRSAGSLVVAIGPK